MIFREKHIPPILDGKKTQTRRKGKKRWNLGAIHTCRIGRFHKPFARVRILEVWEEPVVEIAPANVKAEGYESREEFLCAFAEINRLEPEDLLELEVWAVRFEVVEKLTGVNFTLIEPDEPDGRVRSLADGPGPGGRM